MLAALTFRELLTWNLSLEKQPDYVGWFFDLSHTSPQLHYLLAFGLFYVRRKEITQAFLQGNAAPWSSILFLMPGVSLLLWGHYVSAIDIVYLSFILFCLGAARFLSGIRLVSTILLPILILALAVPLPAVLINQIVFPFQLWTSEHIAWLLSVMGIPSWPEGDMIHMAGHSVRVAESCTALGFMKWLLVFALAYAYLFPVSRLHAVLLILSAPVIAYGVNLMRAFSLIMNPGLEVLELHIAQGVIFFLVGFSLLYAVDTALLRLRGKGYPVDNKRNTRDLCNPNPTRKHRPLLILLTVLSLLFITSVILPRWSDPYEGATTEIALAEEIADWKLVRTPPLIRVFLGSTSYSSYLYRDYVRDKEVVSLFVGYDDRRRREQSMVSDKNAYQDGIGLVVERSVLELEAPKQAAVSILTETEHGRILTYHWYQGVDSVGNEILRALLALDQSPLRRAGGALVIRVATNAPPRPQGKELAHKRLQEFLHDMKNESR